ncbi:MAG: hypothetical protein PHH49_01010 [Candidatus Omnitrophica bacterium]|nr:hypothetical protein [Candidatus Omnitrophota bacterium]MDD5487532.1 hypothetical protein [Candidatus Omnitrophota bacterium]
MPGVYISGMSAGLPDVDPVEFSSSKAFGRETVYASISGHPDIFFFKLREDLVVHAPGIDHTYTDIFRRNGIRTVPGSKVPDGKYPRTCSYNAVKIGRFMFHNLEHTDPVIKELGLEAGLDFVHVPQGYARCSTLVLDDRHIVTSDKGIYLEAQKRGITAGLVSAGGVELPGEKYGLIGGASGTLPDGRVFIAGDLLTHPDGLRIKEMFSRAGVISLEVHSAPLFDAGTVIFV